MKLRLFFILLILAACSSADEDSARPQNVNILATPIPSAMLNAGEINDNEEWQSYLQYRENFLLSSRNSVQDVDVSQRHIITVSDSEGYPVLGARVIVYDDQNVITEMQTDAHGQALFFPSAWWNDTQSYRVVVQKADTAIEFEMDAQTNSTLNVTLDHQQQTTKLDVMFLLDSTGSMGDEIAQLQNNILNISSEIDELQGDVRYGLVTYRDRGDEYVTRTYDFVGDIQEFQANLSAVQADAGGDVPEALNEGLHEAVQGVNWRGDDTIKLIFLVADAPPHLDYPNDYQYTDEMATAVWKGIKIYSIAASNTRPDGEFIFRQLSQYTMGNFIFLIYENGSSGAAGEERTDLEAGQGNYSVEQLDELVLRLITDEIAALNVPIVSNGTSIQTVQTTLQAENRIPDRFGLRASPFQYATSVSYMEEDYGGIDIDLKPFAIMLAIFFIVFVIGVGGVVAGYVLSVLRYAGKRKRKNDEYYNY